MALPESYATVVTVLENMPEEIMNFEFVKTKLRAEAEKKQVKEEICQETQPATFLSRKI